MEFINKFITGFLIVTLVFPAYAADAPERAALSPPLASKPICEVFFNTDTLEWDIDIDQDAINRWNRERDKVEEGELSRAEEERSGRAPYPSIRNRWAFMELSQVISRFIIKARTYDIEDPAAILIPLLRKYIRLRSGGPEVSLEKYLVDKIRPYYERFGPGERSFAGFSLPFITGDNEVMDIRYSFGRSDEGHDALIMGSDEAGNRGSQHDGIFADIVPADENMAGSDGEKEALKSITELSRYRDYSISDRFPEIRRLLKSEKGTGVTSGDLDRFSGSLEKIYESYYMRELARRRYMGIMTREEEVILSRYIVAAMGKDIPKLEDFISRFEERDNIDLLSAEAERARRFVDFAGHFLCSGYQEISVNRTVRDIMGFIAGKYGPEIPGAMRRGKLVFGPYDEIGDLRLDHERFSHVIFALSALADRAILKGHDVKVSTTVLKVTGEERGFTLSVETDLALTADDLIRTSYPGMDVSYLSRLSASMGTSLEYERNRDSTCFKMTFREKSSAQGDMIDPGKSGIEPEPAPGFDRSKEYISNPLMKNILYRRFYLLPKTHRVKDPDQYERLIPEQGYLSSFLKEDHPVKKEVFAYVDAMPYAEVMKEANYLVNLLPDKANGYLGLRTASMEDDLKAMKLTLREIFVMPGLLFTSVNSMLIGNMIDIFDSTENMERVEESMGREGLENRVRSVYILIRAIYLMSRDKDLVLVEPGDAVNISALRSSVLSTHENINVLIELGDMLLGTDTPAGIRSQRNLTYILEYIRANYFTLNSPFDDPDILAKMTSFRKKTDPRPLLRGVGELYKRLSFKKRIQAYIEQIEKTRYSGMDYVEDALPKIISETGCSLDARTLVYEELDKEFRRFGRQAFFLLVALDLVRVQDIRSYTEEAFEGLGAGLRRIAGEGERSLLSYDRLGALFDRHSMFGSQIAVIMGTGAMLESIDHINERKSDISEVFANTVTRLEEIRRDISVSACLAEFFARGANVDRFYSIEWGNIAEGSYASVVKNVPRELFTEEVTALFACYKEQLEALTRAIGGGKSSMESLDGLFAVEKTGIKYIGEEGEFDSEDSGKVLLNNSWASNYLSRVRYDTQLGYRKFLKPDHVLKKEIFDAVDRMSDEEILGAIDVEDLVRRPFILPTIGLNEDLAQIIFRNISGLITPWEIDCSIGWAVEGDMDEYRKSIRDAYLMFKSVEILSRKKDMIILRKDDADYILNDIRARRMRGPIEYREICRLFVIAGLFIKDGPSAADKVSMRNFLYLIDGLRKTGPDIAESLDSKELAEVTDKIGPLLAAGKKGSADTELVEDSTRLTVIGAKGMIKHLSSEKGAKTAVIFSTGWIPGYANRDHLQAMDLNKLITSLRKYSEEKGIPFVVTDKAEEAGLNAELEALRSKYGDIRTVVIAESAALDIKSIADDKSVFITGVDSGELTVDSYMYVTEILRFALELFAKVRTEEEIFAMTGLIGMTPKGNNYLFTPRAVPMDYLDLRRLYSLATFA